MKIVEAARAGTLGSDGMGNCIRNEKLATGENNVKCNCPGETLRSVVVLDGETSSIRFTPAILAGIRSSSAACRAGIASPFNRKLRIGRVQGGGEQNH